MLRTLLTEEITHSDTNFDEPAIEASVAHSTQCDLCDELIERNVVVT